jgi:hypothetical protein
MRKEIKAGIEIECIYNQEFLSRDKAYAISKTLKNWRATPDGSLNSLRQFENSGCVEFVSKTIVGRNRFKKQIETFRDYIIKESKTKDLKKVLSFNDTCGCHIHMGLTSNQPISDLLILDVIKQFRKDFFKRLRNLNIDEMTKERIIVHYKRKYAKPTTKSNYFNHRGRRYYEINRLSERIGKGLEWRSFNLLGVDNWEDFVKVIMLGYDCFAELIKKRLYGYETKKRNIFLKPEIKPLEIQEEIELNKKHDVEEVVLIGED